ncbi:hypothetical protein ABMA27_000810 [Loxostege sticticalis]|uniref:Non-homologous end-joining factor 1 n=1 Tax=Loxostege sticticalis TaxID=481309 RepID=A0ABR3I0G4_LOXSC
MWKNIKNSNLFLRFTDKYEIFITDFVSVWFTYLSKSTFIRCLKDSNILLEMAEEALIEKGMHVLSHPGDIKNVDQKFDKKTLVVSMTMLFGYPFKVTLKLCEGSKELFFQKVTQPLLSTISELKSSQNELCQLLNKKDSEIEEYKRMGGEIAIKFLKTPRFNEASLMNKYQTYQENFGSSDETVHSLVKLKLDVPEDVVTVKQEVLEESVQAVQQTIKMEPDSQMADNQNTQIETPPTTIKQEAELSIKSESQSILPNSRKRMKKLNL